MDQGTKFTSNIIQNITKKFRIKHRMSTPYHPRDNGQVGVTDKVIENILTKIVQQHHKDWVGLHDHL